MVGKKTPKQNKTQFLLDLFNVSLLKKMSVSLNKDIAYYIWLKNVSIFNRNIVIVSFR